MGEVVVRAGPVPARPQAHALLELHPRVPSEAREAGDRQAPRRTRADPQTYESANSFALEHEAASAAAAYLGTDPDLVALTDSTTMGLGLAYRTFRLRAADEVLTTEHDHYSTHESLRFRALADGVTVRKARL